MASIFTARDVRARTGLTYKQIDDLARKRVLGPSIAAAGGKGSRRLYNERDVALLHAVALLRRAGIGRLGFRSAMRALKTPGAMRGDFGARYLVVSGAHGAVVDLVDMKRLLEKPTTITVVLPLAAIGSP